MNRLRLAIGQWIERSIPPGWASDPESLRRARMILGIAVLLLVAAPAELGSDWWTLPAPYYQARLLVLVATTVAASTVVFGLRRYASITLAGHTIVGCVATSMMSRVCITGGTHAPHYPWLGMLPLVGGLIGGPGGAYVWLAVAFASMGVVAVPEWIGWSIPQVIPLERLGAFAMSVNFALAISLGMAALLWEQTRAAQMTSLADACARAEESTRVKSEFLANVSHELRTPMNVIIGMIDMVVDAGVPLESRCNLDRARSAAISLLTIINDLLDSAKVEAGKMLVEVVEMDLRRVIENALNFLRPAAEQKGLALTAVLPATLPKCLRGDPVRIHQVLVNLMSNAIKFTASGGVVLKVRVPSDASGLFLISVRDSGIGLAEEQVAKIFEPFVQGDGSTTRKYGGTGLGLSIAASLVVLMGGRMWVRSRIGHGSTFYFTVRLEATSERASAHAERTPHLASAR